MDTPQLMGRAVGGALDAKSILWLLLRKRRRRRRALMPLLAAGWILGVIVMAVGDYQLRERLPSLLEMLEYGLMAVMLSPLFAFAIVGLAWQHGLIGRRPKGPPIRGGFILAVAWACYLAIVFATVYSPLAKVSVGVLLMMGTFSWQRHSASSRNRMLDELKAQSVAPRSVEEEHALEVVWQALREGVVQVLNPTDGLAADSLSPQDAAEVLGRYDLFMVTEDGAGSGHVVALRKRPSSKWKLTEVVKLGA